MTENEISYKIRGCIFKVHSKLGLGLLESVYEKALSYELYKEGLVVENQVSVPMSYDEIRFDVGFRLDILVEQKVIIEVKSVESLADVHHKQLLTYLKLTERKLGLLVNFNVSKLEDKISIVRIGNFY